MGHMWPSPKTNRVYLHGPGADRVLLLQSDFKITDLALSLSPRHTDGDGCGVLLLSGATTPSLHALDLHNTAFTRPEGGLPLYEMTNRDPENGVRIGMEAFATEGVHPVTYVRVTLANEANATVSGVCGLMPRDVPNGDSCLTGIRSTGYASYAPSERAWYMQRAHPFRPVHENSVFASDTGATLTLLSVRGVRFSWVSSEEQPKRFLPSDLLCGEYTLYPDEQAEIVFAFSATPPKDPLQSYEGARAHVADYYRTLLSHINRYPQTDHPRYREIYRHSILQCLQMIGLYSIPDPTLYPVNDSTPAATQILLPRQGDVGRYIWIWEAVHVLVTLDRVGFSHITAPVYGALCGFISMERVDRGRFLYPYVKWDNAEGALIWGLSEHLRHTRNADALPRLRPYLDALVHSIRVRRRADPEPLFPGLFPAVPAEGLDRRGCHWIFTDAFNVYALTSLWETYEGLGLHEASNTRALCVDYRTSVLHTLSALYRGHEKDEAYAPPHIAGLTFEEAYTRGFVPCGAPYLILLGFIAPDSRLFAQMEAFYEREGLFENGLAGRLPHVTEGDTALWGDVYETGLPELCWIHAYTALGRHDRAEEMHRALLRCHITEEYIPSERYAPSDPHYTPWQPCASGAAHMARHLLSYCKTQEEYKEIQ